MSSVHYRGLFLFSADRKGISTLSRGRDNGGKNNTICAVIQFSEPEKSDFSVMSGSAYISEVKAYTGDMIPL